MKWKNCRKLLFDNTLFGCLFFATILFSCINAMGQENKSSLFLELGGNAYFKSKHGRNLGYSMNFDHIFYEADHMCLSFRGGCAVYKYSYAHSDTNRLNSTIGIFPLELNILVGSSKKHFVEFGLSYVPSVGERVREFFNTHRGIDKYQYYYDYYLVPRAGYRYNPLEKKMFFRAAFTPIFFSSMFRNNPNERYDYAILPWGGISIGTSF